MITNGPYFTETLNALHLVGPQNLATTTNATDIIEAVIDAYGRAPDGTLNANTPPARPVTGLVYGRIQSGKTRAMIASTALAFDNGFKISVVMTSNINDLVAQTHIDFATGLPGIMTYTKDSDLQREVANARLHLGRGDGRLLLVCSKGSTSLRNISQFLRQIGAEAFPTILFDDEGDQASLDTNTGRRTRMGTSVPPSTINSIIQGRLRRTVPRHVYVSVTGTPQAVLLQSADSTHRPSFIVMLPPGNDYVGGDRFFSTDEPEGNPNLIVLVDTNEKQQLLSRRQPIPAGLRASILFFLVSAAAAIRNLTLPSHGYSYLCHPSLKNEEQAKAELRINTFLTDVYSALLSSANGNNIVAELQTAHASLATTLQQNTPSFQECVATIRQYLPSRRLLVINAQVKRQGIQYGRGFNFLIGGNTLGRGIAIRDLLVTYYVRDTLISQIDTMHQHARMYGYRGNTLAYTRLFIPRHLYYRFRDIHHSDNDLRVFIEGNRTGLPATFPVEIGGSLRPTRPGVLDVRRIETLRPGMQIFPNVISIPQSPRIYERTIDQLRTHFGMPSQSIAQMAPRGTQGVEITTAEALNLVSPIRTTSQNTWQDRTITSVITKIAAEFGDRVMLRFRTARRFIRLGGVIPTGTLSGAEVDEARILEIPTLWIMAAETTQDSEVGQGQRFVYPTFVIPSSFPSVFLFNRG